MILKRTKKLKEAQNYAITKNGLCVSKEYVGTKEKMEWKCSNEKHPSWFSSFDNIINRKRWCPNCAKENRSEKRKNKHGLKDAKNYAVKKGGVCLSKEYVGTKEKMEWKCSNEKHPSWFSSFDNTINNKRWCPSCKSENNSERCKNKNALKKSKEYAKSRGGFCLSEEYLNAHKKLKWKCNNSNHSPWFSSYNSIISKSSWCPECSNKNIQEFKTRNILNYLFDTEFIKTRSLIWNRNPKTNKNLELDGYSENLKIAFEFQGRQHYQLTFIKNRDVLKNIKHRDYFKKQNCINNGVKLIIVNEIKSKKFIDFYFEIVRAIKNSGLKIDEYKKNNLVKIKELYEINPNNNAQINYFREAREYAILKNGRCLSPNYINSDEKMEWKCSNEKHPSWFASFYTVVRANHWCRFCSIKKNKFDL